MHNFSKNFRNPETKTTTRKGNCMKKRLLTGALALCMQLPLLSTMTTAQTNESFESFHDRMMQMYDIDIINRKDNVVTQQEQAELEEGLKFWGADIMKTISAYYRYAWISDSPVFLVLKPEESATPSGKVSGYTIYLYGKKWDRITVIHEETHLIHNMWFELGDQNIRKETEAKLRQCNDGREYGSAWSKGDEKYFTWEYGKTNFRDDMATIMPWLYDDRKFIDKINSGQLPAIKKKISVIRDYVVNYIGPTGAFDAVLEPEPSGNKEAVLVIPDVKMLTLSKNKTYQLKTGYTFPMGSIGAVEYSSDNTGIATVDTNGQITSVGPGKATISVKTVRTGNYARCFVSDVKEATSYTFKATQATIDRGGTFQLQFAFKPEGGSATMRYSSDNTNVAAVNECGLITGKSAGTAKISATLIRRNGSTTAPPFVITVTSKLAEIQKPAETTKPEIPAKPADTVKPAPETKPAVRKQGVLTLKTEPVKTTYVVGETFDPAGLTAVYTYPNGKTSAELTPINLSFSCPERAALMKGYKFREAKAMEMTVAYGNAAAKFNIVITAAPKADSGNAAAAHSGKSYAGIYKIFTAASAKQCIGVRGSNMENGAEVIMAPSMNIADQKFVFEKAGDMYRIKAFHSGKYLTVDGDLRNGAFITQSDAVNDSLQLFEVIDSGNGTVQLKTGRGYFVTPNDGSIKTKSRIIIWGEKGNYNQQFKLVNTQ